MKYLVEVTTPLPADIDAAAERVAETFGLQRELVKSLLDRVPGVVTKPLDEIEASRVIDTFGEAGIWARVVPYDAGGPTLLDRVLDAAGSESMKVGYGRNGATVSALSFVGDAEADYRAEIHDRADDQPDTSGLIAAADAGETADSREDEPLAPHGEVASGDFAVAQIDASQVQADISQIELLHVESQADDSQVDVSAPDSGFAANDLSRSTYGSLDPSGGEPATDADPETSTGEAPFDVRAFTEALLSEHGLDESLLDGVESEAEQFDLRDRGARLGEETLSAEDTRRSPFESRVEKATDSGPGVLSLQMVHEGVPPLPLEEEPVAAVRPRRGTAARNGLRSKLLLAGLMPTLLTTVFVLAVVALTVWPLLRAQQLATAASAAGSFAAALSTRLVDSALDSPAAAAELQRAVLEARPSLQAGAISSLLVIDPRGTPLAGWSADGTDPAQIARDLLPAARPNLEAMFGPAFDGEIPFAQETTNRSSDRLAAAPLLVEGRTIGAVLIGSDLVSAGRRARTVLLITAGAVLIPLLIAIVVLVSLTGSLLHNLEYLIRSADRISRGKLARPVELDTGDELSDMARAIERMRISLQEGMERLRKRRQ